MCSFPASFVPCQFEPLTSFYFSFYSLPICHIQSVTSNHHALYHYRNLPFHRCPHPLQNISSPPILLLPLPRFPQVWLPPTAISPAKRPHLRHRPHLAILPHNPRAPSYAVQPGQPRPLRQRIPIPSLRQPSRVDDRGAQHPSRVRDRHGLVRHRCHAVHVNGAAARPRHH